MNYLSSSHKKFATVAIAAALVTTAAIPASAASFSDVSDRYEEAVEFLVEKQIAEGLSASSFGTSKSIKRVDTAIMLAKALELDTTKVPNSGFTDVPARAKSYVDALKAAKIIDGKTATSFAVNQELTRGEAALMLVKAYGLPAAKTKVTLTDVGSRYEAAVAALLENKITSGKTATTFGTQQPITRGEFAVFIHRLENLQKEAAPSSVTVKNETELKAAIASKSINKITLSENVAVKELPTITHYLQLDLNGKTLTADLKYEMAEEQKEISLVSSKADGKLQGNLTVNVPKADFVVGEGVEVAGSAVIINVKENTFHNKGTLNAVDIQDSDGTSFENHGQGAIKGDVSINTVGDVKLIGKVDSVEVNQAAKITVDAAATIAKLNVKVENVVLNAPKGSVGKVEASAGVVVKDSSGQAVVTTPEIPNVPVPNPGPSREEIAKVKSSLNAILKVQMPTMQNFVFENVSYNTLTTLDEKLSANEFDLKELFSKADWDRDGEITEEEFNSYIGGLSLDVIKEDGIEKEVLKALQTIYGTREEMDKVIESINKKIQGYPSTVEIEKLSLNGITLEKLKNLDKALPEVGLDINVLFKDTDGNGKIEEHEVASYIGNLPSTTLEGNSKEAEVFRAFQAFYGDALINTIWTINAKIEMQQLPIDRFKFTNISFGRLKVLNEAMPFGDLNLEAFLNISEADTDKNGRLSEAEFETFIYNLPVDTVIEDEKAAKVFSAWKTIYTRR